MPVLVGIGLVAAGIVIGVVGFNVYLAVIFTKGM
jgi:hypothetical protein